ncbi:unnamed protein product, partial [Closterium sp. Naga37s-1]
MSQPPSLGSVLLEHTRLSASQSRLDELRASVASALALLEGDEDADVAWTALARVPSPHGDGRGDAMGS